MKIVNEKFSLLDNFELTFKIVYNNILHIK